MSAQPVFACFPMAPADQATFAGPACASVQSRARADIEDVELIHCTARGDQRAFEVLYRRYASKIASYMYRTLRRHDLVDEALNDVMFVVWRNSGRFDGRAKVSTWLFGIAHKKALKTLERVRRHQNVTSFDDDTTPSIDELADPDRSSDPELQVGLRDAGKTLAAAMDALSVEHRAVLELTFSERFSCAEIADIIGVSVNTAKSRMFQARTRLAKALSTKRS